MNVHFDTFRTPCGDFSVAVNDAGAVVATAFGGRAALLARLPRCQLLVDTRPERLRDKSALHPSQCQLIDDTRRTQGAREQVLAYFAGERREFDLPLAPAGSEFQHRVWSALQRIPFGETRSYGDLARDLRSAPRAVGRANATNPICVIVPCHRVIGADGSLTGFAFGEEIKRRLLGLEGGGAITRTVSTRAA